MKVGIRKPSIKKRVKARTTGKLKRKAKKAINPFYGKKGMGMIKDPKRAVYNKVYRKTTISIDDIVKAGSGSSKKNAKSAYKKSRKNASASVCKRKNGDGSYATGLYSQNHKSKTTLWEKASLFGSFGLLVIILGIICLFSSISSGMICIGAGALMIFAAGKIQNSIEKKGGIKHSSEGTNLEVTTEVLSEDKMAEKELPSDFMDGISDTNDVEPEIDYNGCAK